MESERDPLRKIPTKHAPEPKADIGTTLRQAREKRGHTLEAVSQQTRISRRYLDALEKNRFDEFPALAYLRGFLKSYCDYLELEFEPLWRVATTEEAKAPASGGDGEQPEPVPASGGDGKQPAAPAAAKATSRPAPAPKPSPATRTADSPPQPKAQPRAHAPAKAAPHQPAHAAPRNDGAVVAVFVLCVLTIGSAIWLVRRPKASAQVQPALPAALAPLSAHPQSRVVLQFRDDVWVSVAADGKPVFEGRVPKASRQEWAMARALSLKAVNPEAIQATVNGAPVKLSHPDAHGVYRIETP